MSATSDPATGAAAAATDPLPPEQRAFIAGGVSMTAGSADSARQVTMARAIGCTLEPDGGLRLLFCPVRAARLLAMVRDSGRIAVAFSQPSTNRTVQVKGSDARVEPARGDDETLRERYAQAFSAELAKVHFPEVMVRVLLQVVAEAPVAIRFTPEAAFSQTPGPTAGAALR